MNFTPGSFTEPACRERRPRSWLTWVVASALLALTSPLFAADASRPLLRPSLLSAPPAHLAGSAWRPVVVDTESLNMARATAASSVIGLLDDDVIQVDHWRAQRNPSGSVSWIGKPRGHGGDGLVVIVVKEGVAIGSIRSRHGLVMLSYAGHSAAGGHVHVLHRVDEGSPRYREQEPSPVHLSPTGRAAAAHETERRMRGAAPGDDGSVQDLLVVYTQRAVDEVGGVTAMENLIDLGVTETNLSYAFSGVAHRLRLVHTALTDYDEQSGAGDPRDLLQDPSDGVMDEVHGIRDQVAADLVKLILAGNGCGRAFIMSDISIAFEEFAFCWTNHVCVSPGYTFQHELGHIQSGRHQRTAPVPDSPFAFNFGYTDPTNRFRTIMAAGSAECPDGCPRRLAWSNPDVADPRSGAPMGLPETDPLPADMRQALDATAWTVANFRVSNVIFADDFESGDTSAWEP